MRKILKIAKLELSILFYSPVAWLVLAIFMVQCSLYFLASLDGIKTALLLGNDVRPITKELFGGQRGLFTNIQNNLYLYLPILTMGLMSRETSSGSIKLLLSSPVKIRQIILGKYLAIIGYGFMLILILAIFSGIGAVTIKHADLTVMISGIFGLFLLICTYSAIGLFMSSLTNYQVVAAISTLAVFAALRFVGSMGQGIDFVRDLTYFLSISGRAQDMVDGLISSKDVLYFIIISTLFLSLCIMRLQSDREAKTWTIKTGRYALLICVALLFGYFTSRPGYILYKDMTAYNYRTLTKASQQVAKKIDGPLKITTYVNLMDTHIWMGLPQNRNYDLKGFAAHQRFIPKLQMNYVYYYDTTQYSREIAKDKNNKNLNFAQLAEKQAITLRTDFDMYLPPSEIRKIIDLRQENNGVVRKLEYKGKSSFLRFYSGEDPVPTEGEITAAIKRLVVHPPKLVFLTGNNERSIDKEGDRDYKLISGMKERKNALINQGFDVDSLDLNNQEIADNTNVLILGDPTTPLKAKEQQKIADYLNKGGNMLITGEPGRQSILNPILQLLGMQMKAGMLVKPDRDLTPGLVPATIASAAADLDSNFKMLVHYNQKLKVQGAAALEYKPMGNFKVSPLLLSPAEGWNKLGEVDLTSTDISYNPSNGDQKGVLPIAVSITRDINHKQQRIIVSGDGDFFDNATIRPRSGVNEYFMYGMFSWFAYGTYPIDVSRPDLKDIDLYASREQITLMKVACDGIIPALIAVFGAIVLFKRRRS